LLSIQRLLYSLKRRFGQRMDFYREIQSQPNILTGKINQEQIKFRIKQGVFLDQILETRSPLTKILGQLSGMIDTFDVAILIDGRDFPKHFKPHLKDYVIVEHQRYEIKTVQEVDDEQSLYITMTEYKGSTTYEQKDKYLKQKLNIIQLVSVEKSHIYVEDLVDELPLDDSIYTFSGIQGYISDVLDLVDGIEINNEYINTIVEVLNDNLEFFETLESSDKALHLIDQLRLKDQVSLNLPPVLHD
jgi:hypothetical protein